MSRSGLASIQELLHDDAREDLRIRVDVMGDKSLFSIRAVLMGMLVGLLVLPVSPTLEWLMFPPGSDPRPEWYAWVREFASILNFLPGYVAGYIAMRRPFRHGLLIAAGSTLLAPIAATLVLGEVPTHRVLPLVLIGFVVASIPSMAGAWWGTWYRGRPKIA